MATVAILGVGERGAGWAARCRLMGVDVTLFDPEPGGLNRAQAACDAAGAALPAVYDVALPRKGRMQEAKGIAAAVAGADWVIEAAPDRAELKRALFRTALAEMGEGMKVLSTATNLDLEELQGLAPRPDAIARLQAAGPAWLLPLAHLEGLEAEFLEALGMASAPLEAGQAVLDAGAGEIAPVVAVLRALKARDAGAGAALAAHEARIAPRAPRDLRAPPVTMDRQVPPDWVDYNGHMNEARYLTAFSEATDRLLLWAGMDADCVAEGHSVFTVETHIRHLGEVDIGDRIEVRTRVLDGTGKRLHLWHEMTGAGGAIAATAEQLLLHVHLSDRKVGPPRADVGEWLEAAEKAHADLPAPDGLGRYVGAPRS